VKKIIESDSAMLMVVNGKMAKHQGSEDELNAMIGKAIQKGDLAYDGIYGNLLIKDNGVKMVKQKAQTKGIHYF